MKYLQKIVSCGQTGADRAALDFAIEHHLAHGGWCPKGRLAEDGVIATRYQLQETSTKQYPQRTEKNVQDSDGTVIFTMETILSGGSKKTAEFAAKHRKPWIHLARETAKDEAQALVKFIDEHGVAILNVAGSRASKEPGVYQYVKSVLEAAIAKGKAP